MTNNIVASNPVEIFLKSWRVYREIIEHNYMFHREISAAMRSALARFKTSHSLRILDLGCGDASMTLPLLSAGRIASYIGCDLSQPALDIARKELDDLRIPHKIICEDMVQVMLEQPDASVDVVFSSYALHHLNATNKQRILAEITRTLTPGGCFMLIDIFREPTEDRPAYMRNYMGTVQADWTKLAPESQRLVINHATEYDFPEHSAFYETQCTGNGLASGVQLAKHTWHQAWLYFKPPNA